MKNATRLIVQLRSRLSQDPLTDAEFTQALPEILSGAPARLSGGESLLLSHKIRELKQEWRNSLREPVE